MSLGAIRINGKLARPLLILAALVCVVWAWLGATWYFANGVSTRVDIKEMADIMIGLSPSDPQTHYAAAVLYEKTFDPADALRALAEFEAAAALTPNNYLPWLDLAKARERAGDTTGSEKAFVRALELAPNYADVQWAYGNSLLRAGRTKEGFALLAQAAAGKPEYVNPAAITAMTILDGDAERVRGMLGNSPAVNAALAVYMSGQKRFADAISFWEMIPADERRTSFKQAGETLASQLAGAQQFRMASRVAGSIWESEASAPAAGRVTNGGFESEIKLSDNRLFGWQFGNAVNPQVGLSDAQKHGGTYSLFMSFNTMQAADMRQVAQTIAVEPGTPYTLEIWYRAELKGNVVWEIVDACEGKPLGRTAVLASAADWTRISADLASPSACDGITVRLVRDGCISSVCPINGKLWIDEFSLLKR